MFKVALNPDILLAIIFLLEKVNAVTVRKFFVTIMFFHPVLLFFEKSY